MAPRFGQFEVVFGVRFALIAFLLAGCDDGALESSAAACVVFGEELAVGETRDDPTTCTRCTCHAVGSPGCAPLPGCGDVGAADDGGGGDGGPDARFLDGATDSQGDGSAPDGAPPGPEGDRDGDGQPDEIETTYGSDPDDPNSRIPHFLWLRGPDWTAEIELAFDLELRAADIVFLLDTTSSMRPLLRATSAELGRIIGDLGEVLPRATYGAAAFDDYAQLPFGTPGTDLPFVLHHQQTVELDAVQAAIAGMEEHSGNDVVESALEALYQVLTGAGYDQNCDGEYDAVTDVRPFTASAADAFGGNTAGASVAGVVGTGKSGGVGFNGGALPIIVYGTDASMRDPARGHRTPDGCPGEADHRAVVDAARQVGARLVGIEVGQFNDLRHEQMSALAVETGSMVDLDGDDLVDPVLLAWVPGDPGFREGVVHAITQLLGGLSFARGEVEAEDPNGLVQGYDPPFIGPVPSSDFGTTRVFDATLRAAQPDERRVVELRFELVADGAVILDDEMWVVVIEP